MAATIAIAAGGTAGHVVPALAVADALRAEGARVVFVGGERAERTLVPQAGYELRLIAVEGLSRTNPLKAARAAAKAVGAVGAAARAGGGRGGGGGRRGGADPKPDEPRRGEGRRGLRARPGRPGRRRAAHAA